MPAKRNLHRVRLLEMNSTNVFVQLLEQHSLSSAHHQWGAHSAATHKHTQTVYVVSVCNITLKCDAGCLLAHGMGAHFCTLCICGATPMLRGHVRWATCVCVCVSLFYSQYVCVLQIFKWCVCGLFVVCEYVICARALEYSHVP